MGKCFKAVVNTEFEKCFLMIISLKYLATHEGMKWAIYPPLRDPALWANEGFFRKPVRESNPDLVVPPRKPRRCMSWSDADPLIAI